MFKLATAPLRPGRLSSGVFWLLWIVLPIAVSGCGDGPPPVETGNPFATNSSEPAGSDGDGRAGALPRNRGRAGTPARKATAGRQPRENPRAGVSGDQGSDADSVQKRVEKDPAERKFERALAEFEEAALANRNLPAAHNNRGTAYFNHGDYEKAIEDFSAAIRLDATFAEAYHNRGVAYETMQDFKKADADYAKAKELDPRFK